MISLWSFVCVSWYCTSHFHKDICHSTNEVIQNWENFYYNPWHVDCNSISLEDPHEYEYENEDFPYL